MLAARVAPLERALEFADLVATGLTDAPRNAARMLHEKLLSALMKKERLDQVELATITARSWNHWISGRELKPLKVMPDDRSGRNFPTLIGPPETAE